MTNDEVRKLLDEILPAYYSSTSLANNSSLSDDEIDLLCQIISDWEEEKPNSYYKEYEKSLDTIAPIMRRYNSDSMKIKSRNPSQVTIPRKAKGGSCPHLIKQVLFYIAVTGQMQKSQGGISQKTIIDCLRQNGVVISHNFFSRMDYNPTDFLSLRQYKQPKMPCNYNGQKHDELGHAIAYLVYQAGKHNCFVDLFGGTGAATLSFKHRRNSKYVYNELNDQVFNLFRVLADKKLSKQLITYLLKLQKAMRLEEEEAWLSLNDLHEQAEIFYDFSQQSGRYKGEDGSVVERGIIDLKSQKFTPTPESKKNFEKLLKDIRNNRLSVGSPAEEKYWACHCVNNDAFKGTYEDGREASFYSYFRDRMQFMTYCYYAYFDNIYRSNIPMEGNEALFAVAELFKSTLVTNTSRGVSAVTRMTIDTKAKNVSKNPYSFMENKKNLDEKIKKVSEILKTPKMTLENDTFSNIIPKYKSAEKPSSVRQSKVIFYADPPYAGTADYESEEGGVDSFTDDDMKNLIKTLVNCGDKFIYSCRTTGSNKSVKERNKTTKDIFDTVFYNFIEHWVHSKSNKVDNPFWVLAIEKKPDKITASFKKALDNANAILEKNGLPTKGDEIDLASLTYADQAPEIMITNFEIKDIPITQKQKNFRYKVYTFDEFVKILLVKGEMLGFGKVDRDLLN